MNAWKRRKSEKKTQQCRKTEVRRRLRRGMVGSRWRFGASKDNDVKHEDHRYRIGLANGTKDIQLMIPYVTRRVFTRRLVTLLISPATPNNQSTVMFHLRNPQMDRRIPPFVRSIFFHSTSEGWGARRRWILVGRILPSPHR